jgi:hypothetical protein
VRVKSEKALETALKPPIQRLRASICRLPVRLAKAPMSVFAFKSDVP